MSHKSDKARLEYLLKMISDIERICERHHGITHALEDNEGFHAITMCCFQIGEVMNKIEAPEIREKLPISLSYSMRNIIAHDYIGVDPRRIADTVEKDIPDLKCIVETILEQGDRIGRNKPIQCKGAKKTRIT